LAGSIIFYNSGLSFITAAYLFPLGAYSYQSKHGIIGVLSQKADDSGVFDRIEILDHGNPGMATVGEGSTIASSTGLITHDNGMLAFWMTLGRYMARTSCLILNMCNCGKSNEGQVLLREIQRLTGGIVYGAVKDMTHEVGMHYHNDPTKYRHYMH
jgi:hypothetical protein